MKASEIRKAFFDYFQNHDHYLVESSSLVPANDPTLLFTNAGMVQFKEIFLGHELRPYARAVSSQRCVRAGGKHNDLENVGYTARHHTFFEMLGNFSFGDYFKREAIAYSWEFLTQVLKIPQERLWVTVYTDDDDAADIWLKEIGVSPERFSRCGDKDNFWSMGDTGPCGPCSEIFYDHGENIPGGPPGTPEQEGDRYVEIWNLVFMQYNRDKEGQLHPLPKPSVDTGMGLERIAAVVQGVHSNYEIDSFQYVITAIAKLANIQDLTQPSLKVIADHIRTCAFLIADGVLPGNEGRGYVLRRIIRRAVRHGNKLGLPRPFFYLLLEPLIDVTGEAYPVLSDKKEQIQRILKQEENQFAKTLEQGLNLLESKVESLSDKVIPGDFAFKLYDTYGFPVDLTADLARERGLNVDMAGFEEHMQKQKAQSQASQQFQVNYSDAIKLDERSDFQGYEEVSTLSAVKAILIDGKKADEVNERTKATIILEHTPFYPESGGQVGDKGVLIAENMLFDVEDTQKLGQAIAHYGALKKGKITLNQTVEARIDEVRRTAIRLNHTATHLLHAALKQILGEHVEQKGSLVDAERARFDFSHYHPITPEQLKDIESLVNTQIQANLSVKTDMMSMDEAKKSGAIALFGEKYEDDVRVLTISDFSKELCGGTHVKQTGDIGLFKITSEYGIASGVRRIEMVTGHYALVWVHEQQDLLVSLADKLKTTPAKAYDKLSQLLHESKQQERELSKLQEKLAVQSGQSMLSDVQKVGHVNLLIKKLEQVDGQVLRATMDQLKSSLESAVIIIYTKAQGKMSIIAGVSKDIIGTVPTAADFVKAICGKGGGRADMAQGGGEAPDDLEQRIEKIPEMITSFSST